MARTVPRCIWMLTVFLFCAAHDRENLLINRLQNARIVYYHALQEISDSVEAAKFTDAEKANNYASAIQSCLDEEKKLRSKIDLLDGKRRYLKTLGNETRRVEPRICAICGDRYDRAAVTPCGHFFCISCLTKSVELHHRCPGCNASLSVDEITAVSFTDTKDQQAMAQTLPFKPVSSFCTMADDALTAKVSKVQIKGSFGSKLDTILKHILSLDPTEKVALFSQWDQVLDLLAKGLSLNGIKYVRFRGAQRNTAAIRFRRDPEIRVFILDARSQSAGLTLVSATHVMLVEPILHPGIELQAINRVHRIGQARRTHVWRYIVGGTIEEGLFELYETRRRAISGRSEEFDGETAEDLENARMLPLANRAAGEVVGNGDIIRLLKGALGRRAEKEEVDIDMEESTD